jgi:formylglycine-generating enzyme required for sulfatase activity
VPVLSPSSASLGAQPSARQVRTWTDSTGTYTIEAEFLDFKDGKVRLRKPDGKQITLPIGKLSDADRRFVERQLKGKPIPAGAMRELTVDLGRGVKLEMALIPAGEFLMGSPESDKDAYSSEKPQHRVRITKPFYLGKYLVTQQQWEAIMGNDPSHFEVMKNPVEQVSWNDCQQFLDKLNAKPHPGGGKFRLPTEAQWEYACRAGSTTRYGYGDDESGLGEYAWYGKNSDNKPHPAGWKRPNAWGLYDMHGNVWEWCADWFDGGYYAHSPADDPPGPATGVDRVLRGGCWSDQAAFCRSARRYFDGPRGRSASLGLRICKTLPDRPGE